MSDVTTSIGAKLDPSYKGSLHDAITAVREFADEVRNPLASVAAGTRVVDAGFDYIKDTIKESVLGPLGALLVSAGAVEGAMWLLDKADRSVAAGLQQFSVVQDLEAQFRPLLGSAAEAKARLQELQQFSDVTPYQLTDVAAASKMLQVLTNGALATGKELRQVGDAAAMSGGGLQDVAMQIGRMYDDLQNGRPMGLAAHRLEELGILSGKTRVEIEKLQKEGKSGSEVWAAFSKDLDRANGSMALLSQTITGLNSTYADARAAVGRAVGEGFAQTEMDSVKAATQVTKNFIPIAKEAAQVANSFGMANWPSMWFPMFDVQVKQFLAWLLQAKSAWIAFINVTVVMGVGLLSTIVLTAVGNIKSWIGTVVAAASASRDWALAQKEVVLSTELSTAALQANLIALTENGAAALKSRAILLMNAGAMGILRLAASKLTTVLKDVGSALLSKTNIFIASMLALYSAREHILRYIEAVKTLGAATIDRVSQIHAERDAIVTVQDKIDALSKAYSRLKEQQDAVAAEPHAGMRVFLQSGEDAIKRQIALTQAIDSTQLKASPARQAMLDAHDISNPNYADQLEREMTTKGKLAFLEIQRNALLEKWVDLQKKADDATANADPKHLADIDAQIAEKKKELADSQARLDELYAHPQGGKNYAKVLGAAQATELPLQKSLSDQIDALENSKQGVDAAYEDAATKLQDINDRLDKNASEQQTTQAQVRREDLGEIDRKEELQTEQQVLLLKSLGLQRTVDEAHLRQALYTLQFQEAEALGDKTRMLDLQNKYLEEQLKITDAQRESDRQLQDIQENRLNRAGALIAKLPKSMQIPFLKQEQAAYQDQAKDYDRQAYDAHQSGDRVREFQLRDKADDARDKASDLGEVIRQAINKQELPGQVDAMQKIGGGGRIAPTFGNVITDKVGSIKDILSRIEGILKNQNSGTSLPPFRLTER